MLRRVAPQVGVSPQCMASPALLLESGDSVCPVKAWFRGKGCGISSVTLCLRQRGLLEGTRGQWAGTEEKQ